MRILPLILLLAAGPAAADMVVTAPVSFSVTNPQEPLSPRTVRGTLYLPGSNQRCSNSVVLMLHGLSYGAWAWDFPLDNGTYSMARAIASRGYPAVTVDELGYGASDHPNGWNLAAQSYGTVTGQMVSALRSGSYSASAPIAFQRVILFGHSAGTEMAELAAGSGSGVAGLIAGAYTHFPSAGIFLSVLTQDSVAALAQPYVYFDSNSSKRAGDMYDLSTADPAIVSRDTQLANLTPSGEILSIAANQPSRAVLPLITAPVLLMLAQNDALFPPDLLGISYAQAELALFTAAFDKSLYVVPAAGHTFMLHPNAPQTQQVVVDWLGERYPTCVH